MKRIGLLWAVLLWSADIRSDEDSYLPRAHAHNDYAHERPLLDALSHGFASVESDIFLVGNQILVGHSLLELKKDRTLEKLYLDPLLDRVGARQGWVYGPGERLFLLIDFKSNGEKTYARLREALRPYASMLSRLESGTWQQGAVTIVVSGDRPIEKIASDPSRMVGIDGRAKDIDSALPANVMPMISESWGSMFRWKGEGPMPTAERETLQRFVDRAHARGRVVRFWATPEKESVWDELRSANVDLMNTDDLPGLRAYLLRGSP
jgi:hypothetical protein